MASSWPVGDVWFEHCAAYRDPYLERRQRYHRSAARVDRIASLARRGSSCPGHQRGQRGVVCPVSSRRGRMWRCIARQSGDYSRPLEVRMRGAEM